MELSTVVQIVGYLFLAQVLFTLGFNLYRYFARSPKNLKKFGSWAIVTGCTDGIGEAIANEFAKKGLNLILVSRSAEKLSKQAQDVESKYKVQTKTFPIDFTVDSPTLFDELKTAVKDLDVGILVNNVGIAYEHAEYFHLLDSTKIQQIIQVNVKATTLLSYLVLPYMVERKRGCIVNVGSISSLVSEPLYAVYSGSKGYINNFSEALHYEYKKYNISVQAQLPGLVTSKLSKIRHASFFIPSAASYAKSFVAQLGYEPVSISFWPHALGFGVLLSLPRQFVAQQLYSRGLGIRSRAYKKKTEKQQ